MLRGYASIRSRAVLRGLAKWSTWTVSRAAVSSLGSSLGCCCLSEIRQVVVRRPPRERHRDRLHYGVGRDLHYGVGAGPTLRCGGGTYTTVWGLDLHYGVGAGPTLRCGAGPTLRCGAGPTLRCGGGTYTTVWGRDLHTKPVRTNDQGHVPATISRNTASRRNRRRTRQSATSRACATRSSMTSRIYDHAGRLTRHPLTRHCKLISWNREIMFH